tara:strand:+ start:492 stop:671 length:180 start_codon:yes stop_codon:yes gene_type:complete
MFILSNFLSPTCNSTLKEKTLLARPEGNKNISDKVDTIQQINENKIPDLFQVQNPRVGS